MSTLSTILAVILAVAFLGAGITKLTRRQQMVDNFKRWGYADAVLMATGGVECLAAVLILAGIALPALAIAGGLLIIFVMVGALLTHQRAKDELAMWVAPLVLLALDVGLLVSMLPDG